MSIYRMLVVGAGFWGKEWTKTIIDTPDLELAGIVTKEMPTCDEAAMELGLNRNLFFEDYNQAIEKIQADIVIVVVPPVMHLPVIDAAMKAGKHVICEKPLADTWTAGTEIARIVKNYPNQYFMVSQTRRYIPQVQTIKRFLLGIEYSKNMINYGWRLNLYSVVLEDMSAHHFDLFRYITKKEPVSVYAEGWRPDWSQYPGKVCHNVLIRMTDDIHINYFATWTEL